MKKKDLIEKKLKAAEALAEVVSAELAHDYYNRRIMEALRDFKEAGK